MTYLPTRGLALAAGICLSCHATNVGVPTPSPPPPQSDVQAAIVAHLRTAPGYTTTRTGGPHDFDWMAGAWTTTLHRLKARHAGSHDWEDFPGSQCVTLYLDGLVTADEIFMPTKGLRGFTVRTFDLAKRQWSIFWVTDKTGKFDSGVFGGFEGDRGEFYGEDTDQGLPVVARYVWTHRDADHARWEQAFSYDGLVWETNWTADYVRADPAAICQAGRPHIALRTAR